VKPRLLVVGPDDAVSGMSEDAIRHLLPPFVQGRGNPRALAKPCGRLVRIGAGAPGIIANTARPTPRAARRDAFA
jgi:hypothetical protein